MALDLQLSSRSLAILLGNIFGPSYYDGPQFGDGDPGPGGYHVDGPRPNPWRAVMLNPQPLPPRETYALRVADAYITDILGLDRIGGLFGGEARELSLKHSLNHIAYLDEICPRWPKWPKRWPPPPPPPWRRDELMNPSELLLFGSRILAASQLVEQPELGDALGRLGEKALDFSMRG